MEVRAKFKCWAVTHGNDPNPNSFCARVQFMAAYDDGNEDNKSWSKYTPSGSLDMYVTNPAAIEAFEPGKYYYLAITPAD